jgi:hypothetical protein
MTTGGAAAWVISWASEGVDAAAKRAAAVIKESTDFDMGGPRSDPFSPPPYATM